MTLSLAPTQSDIDKALVAFMASVLPDGMPIVVGQLNRVPEPAAEDFIEYIPLRKPRLSTNFDDYIDAQFTASIAGDVMTVSAVAFGALKPGLPVFGVDVAAGTKIVTGGPGVGSYTINNPQTIASRTLAAGVVAMLQSTKLSYLVDAHGLSSSDSLQAITTAFRDIYAADFFNDPGRAGVAAGRAAPLYPEEPRQMPFLNEAQQIESRWAVELCLQANQILEVPQQFAAQLAVRLIAADNVYPA